eukprot:TRINITY_DN19715_c0_g1_i7.p1 TRINITY_DN19715_c0_g1~~TRINITY_DN19715_c0_g1_i7.p1  ORF type:complete len:229 (+),score=30.81 TRINITY_DN19715_c0_g1_i7:89-775(+)
MGISARSSFLEIAQLPLPVSAKQVRLYEERHVRFLFLCGAMFVLMALSGYFEERLYKVVPDFDYFWTVAFVELAVFTVAGGIEMVRQRGREQKASSSSAPVWLYFAAAVALALNQSVGKLVNRYVNYATNLVFKSVNLMPTLLFSAFYLGRTHGFMEWIAASLLVTSCCAMALGDAQTAPEFKAEGMLVAGAGSVLAVTRSMLQEKALKDYDAPISECLFFTNGAGAG